MIYITSSIIQKMEDSAYICWANAEPLLCVLLLQCVLRFYLDRYYLSQHCLATFHRGNFIVSITGRSSLPLTRFEN